jgi:hypothetical protein
MNQKYNLMGKQCSKANKYFSKTTKLNLARKTIIQGNTADEAVQ